MRGLPRHRGFVCPWFFLCFESIYLGGAGCIILLASWLRALGLLSFLSLLVASLGLVIWLRPLSPPLWLLVWNDWVQLFLSQRRRKRIGCARWNMAHRVWITGFYVVGRVLSSKPFHPEALQSTLRMAFNPVRAWILK
ncbi:UNVERIFIED_CONTAM: hypothetical protein Sangu_3233900 [Sesamum angustifolium]|uniref:Uncharacterized protein n=1 Tax=Sesamum angustifolium TaxID=2727405 RepID=A0AAW2JJB5_9LAMI